MRRWSTAALLGGLLMGHPSPGQEVSRPAPAATPRARAEGPHPNPPGDPEALLAAWEERAAARTSLQVAFERVDKGLKWGDKVYAGRAFFRGPDLCVEFTQGKTAPDGKPQRREVDGRSVLEVEAQPIERIVMSPKEIAQYEWDIRTIYRYPLPGSFMVKVADQARWLCDLPFLFGRTAAEVKARYEVTLIPVRDPTRAAKFHLIRFVPREEIDRRSLREAFLYLDKQTFLPDRLVLIPPGLDGMQDFRVTAIRVNEPIPDQVFATDRAPEGWQVVKGDGPSSDWLLRLILKIAEVHQNPARLIELLPDKQAEAR